MGVAAERLDRRTALLDAVGVGIRTVFRTDLIGDGRGPRKRNAGAREVAQPIEAAALRRIEHLEEIHRYPWMLLESRSPDRDEMHDREDAGRLEEALLLGAAVGKQPHNRATGREGFR